MAIASSAVATRAGVILINMFSSPDVSWGCVAKLFWYLRRGEVKLRSTTMSESNWLGVARGRPLYSDALLIVQRRPLAPFYEG
jgi:hypothetical protein